ncbi:hypothetical protein ZIOFF_035797 [Zingiber officinale]|uniref:Uncharacterized protein n=2 Tax=Zingiber officinale TaxID=94328 RepID=A0A8J5GHN9_ZINOF|nr:hypothetical protein ZIOFF_035797 [Zingiber officinale]
MDGRSGEVWRPRRAAGEQLGDAGNYCSFGMKCKIHPYEYGDGVCASCLKERLLALIAAQNELSSHQYHTACQRIDFSAPSSEYPPPPPHQFPSPYISHRRSVGFEASPAHVRLHHRFFSTPQVGPAFRAANGAGSLDDLDSGSGRRKQRFSIVKALFGHTRSQKADPDLGDSAGPASGSWITALIRGRSKKKHKKKSEEDAPPSRKPQRSFRDSEYENDFGEEYSTTSSRRPTSKQFPGNHPGSGFSVCLSPLANFGQEGRQRYHPTELGLSGKSRAAIEIATLASNRPRNLADGGRLK